MTPTLLAAAAGLLPPLAYGLSCFAEVRGLHDWLAPGSLWRTAHPYVVLSFDDGPDRERTPRLLDLLAAHETKAVFFLVGEQVAREPAIARRIVAEGHQVGNHSWSHPWFVRLSRPRLEDEIDRCQAAIQDATGVSPVWARPPYGQRDFRTNRALLERGLTPVLWSRNLRDYYGSSPKTLARRLGRARPGEVVLCHDGDPLAKHTLEGVALWLATQPRVGLL